MVNPKHVLIKKKLYGSHVTVLPHPPSLQLTLQLHCLLSAATHQQCYRLSHNHHQHHTWHGLVLKAL